LDTNPGTIDQPYQTISQGVGSVDENGTVYIANGNYAGTDNNEIVINKNMTITGQSQTGTIINGSNTSCIFRISENVTVTLKNLTFVNGRATGILPVTGGAISNNGTLTVVNCNFTDNYAYNYGGAIHNSQSGTLTVNNSIFTSNYAGNGGAISNWGTLILDNSTFNINNVINFGGAIYNDGDKAQSIPYVGNVTVTNCTFTKNIAGTYDTGSGSGGAIYTQLGDLTVDNCIFTGQNALRGEGGAIYSVRSTSKFSNSSFTDNWVYRGSGGAIKSEGTSLDPDVLTVINCTFTSNSAQYNAGAIGSRGSSIINITGSTFTNNTADNYGGAIEIHGTLNVTDCNFTNNTARSFGGAIKNNGICTINGSTFTSNSATTYGGAIYNGGSTFNTVILTIMDSNFTNNTSQEGGAIWGYDYGTYVKVSNSNFTANFATNGNWGYGGGAIGTMCKLDVINCTFTANNASYDGAAIWNNNVTQIVNCTFTNNHAESGAIWNTGNGICTVTSSNFTDNTAGFGAGIENYGTMTIDKCRFTNNSASNGGAISHLGKSLTITNCNFTGNSATNGGVIWADYNTHSSEGPFTITSCIFTDNSATGQGSVVWNDRGSDTGVMHFNRIFGNTGNYDVYSANGTIDAENNWWGDNFNGTNPLAAVRVNNNVDADPWIILKWNASPDSIIDLLGTSNATADMRYNSNGIIPSGALPEGTVRFTVNNSGNINPLNGTIGSTIITTIFTPAKYGLSTINATLDGFSLSTSVLVNGITTSLTINAASGYKGNNTTLTATLWDTTHNKAITGETIEFYVNGNYIGQNTTNSNGLATYNYQITQNIGTYTINTTLNATTQYEPSNGTNTLTVNAIPTSLTINAASGYKGNNTTLTATLWDTTHNKAITGETIEFYVNGNYIGQNTTDNNGLATYNYQITQNIGTYTINTTLNATTQYAAITGANNLIVNATPTSLTIDNVTGNKGTNVTLKAVLTDTIHSLAIGGKKVSFKVNGAAVGNATTDTNGVATLPYYIDIVGGKYTVDALFAADNQYASSNVTGTLKIPQSSVYVVVTSSKKDPKIGETFTLTYKLGNNGPDPAENVIIIIPLPEGFELSNVNGDGNWTYNEKTRTITWTFTNLAVGDPYLYVTGKLTKAGAYLFSLSIATATYNGDTQEITPITINAKNPAQVNAANNTITMQNTGTPMNYLLIAILMVLSGFLVSKRK